MISPSFKSNKSFLSYLIVTDVVLLLLVVCLSVMAAGPGVKIGLFPNTTSEIYTAHPLDISLAGWMDIVWVIVHLWNALFMIYAMSTLYRRKFGLDVCVAISDVLTPSVYATFGSALTVHIAWIFSWCYGNLALAFILNLAQTMLFCACLFIAHITLRSQVTRMRQTQPEEVWLIRCLVHNGVAMWTHWSFLQTLINLAQLMVQSDSVLKHTASTIVLSIFALDLVCWFIFENVILDNYVRYTAAHYVIDIIGMAAIVSTNKHFDTVNAIYAFVLLLACSAMFVVHVSLGFWRHCNEKRKFSGYERIVSVKPIAVVF